MYKSLSQFGQRGLLAGIGCLWVTTAAGQAPASRVTATALNPLSLGKSNDPCGSMISLDGHIDTTGPGKVWYRFVVPPGVSSPPEVVFDLKPNTMAVSGAADFTQDFKGPFRLEAAMVGADGKHGPVIQSAPVIFEGKCASGAPKSPLTSPPSASSQGLPGELPLPPGVTTTRVDRVDFGQEDIRYPNSNRTSEYLKVAGHLWRAFLKGDPQSLGVPAWRAVLEQAGWQVLNPTPGNTVARRGDWWAKIGTDRLTLVQRAEAEALQLSPPGEQPEELKPNQDAPYITPLPATVRNAWKTEPPFELKGNKDPESRMLGPAVYIRYQGAASLSGVEIQTRYNAALQKAGWDVVRSDAGGVTGAHYTQHGRDVWAKITPLGSSYAVEIADMGAAARQDKLSKALDDDGHVALYGIYFDTDKVTLRPDSQATLVQVQQLLVSHPALIVEIQGHTDNTGNRPHNQTLSDDRAASVRGWLIDHGIAANRLTAKGYADTKPVAPNDTTAGRALNRRVELARR